MSYKDSKHNDQTTSPEALAEGLSGLLADTYVLYNRTQLYHWNVEGPHFRALHGLFESQYQELAEAVDVIAERIRAVGFYTPGSLPELLRSTRLRETRVARDANEILIHLINGHQQVVHRARQLRQLADEACDDATEDLLIERIRKHEKAAWILKSQAGDKSQELASARARPLEAVSG